MTVIAPAEQTEKSTGEYTRWSDIIKHWPKTTLLIVSNEFCERFSYYGMKSVLFIYLTNILMFSDSTAIITFSIFNFICFSTPLLGSIIADGYIGKFWTIFIVSIFYTAGQMTLAMSAFGAKGSWVHPWLDIIGLLVIAIGTGGIKPCVSSFGGDQFPANQVRMLSLFFSVFYFSINAGAVISSWISPMFRSQSCLGLEACFPFAFGAPAALMIIATVIFMSGSFWYKKNPPKENIFAEVFRVIVQALRNKGKADIIKEHWIDHYLNTHDCHTDNKELLLPTLSIYFEFSSLCYRFQCSGPCSINNQHLWMQQGVQLDTRLFFGWHFLPDQMTSVNGLLILIMIPIAQVIVYPLVNKFICKFTPLRKMVAGGLIAALAFVIAALVQLQVNKSLAVVPEPGIAYIGGWNQLENCGFNMSIGSTTQFLNSSESITDDYFTGKQTWRADANPQLTVFIEFEERCSKNTVNYTLNAAEKQTYTIVVTENGIYQMQVNTQKPKGGNGEFSVSLVSTITPEYSGMFALCRIVNGNPDCGSDVKNNVKFAEPKLVQLVPFNGKTASNASVYEFKPIVYGNFELFYTNKTHTGKTTGISLNMPHQGGVYVLALAGNETMLVAQQMDVVPYNRVGILWQFPQYIIITAGEVLFSVTGYEFAYSESAPSMKAMVQAFWLLTVAFGDLIILFITVINPFENMATLYFAFAAAMTIVMGILTLMAVYFYDYRYDEDNRITDSDEVESNMSDYHNNPFFNSDTEEATPNNPPVRRLSLGETKF